MAPSIERSFPRNLLGMCVWVCAFTGLLTDFLVSLTSSMSLSVCREHIFSFFARCCLVAKEYAFKRPQIHFLRKVFLAFSTQMTSKARDDSFRFSCWKRYLFTDGHNKIRTIKYQTESPKISVEGQGRFGLENRMPIWADERVRVRIVLECFMFL
jgi:hypothetical protein